MSARFCCDITAPLTFHVLTRPGDPDTSGVGCNTQTLSPTHPVNGTAHNLQ